jgi:hypothetical protein
MSGLYMWMGVAGFFIAFLAGSPSIIVAVELHKTKTHPAKIVLIVLSLIAQSAGGAFMCGYGAQHYDELTNARKGVQD